MIRPFFYAIVGVVWLAFACSMSDNSQQKNPVCKCDTLKTIEIIKSKGFNAIPKYDTPSFHKSDFYELDSTVNRELWYRDIENIDTTKFTNLWDDYSPANYHASHLDFVKYYKNRSDIELAFQFGPNMDLWAYHIFVIKKVGCCFLVTRSYFRHARFNYKAYAISTEMQIDTLYSILNKINCSPIGDKEEFKYRGYFVDNRNKKSFFIDFEKETSKTKEDSKPKPEIKDLYNFVDKHFHWTKTYEL